MLTGGEEGMEEWRKTVRDYRETNKKLPWGTNPSVSYVKEADVKKIDNIYNPILQRYNDQDRESNVKEREQSQMVQTLAKNKDRALRYEQTYNIITFEDKLKGLEDHPDYPKEKPWKFKGGSDTNVDYNILSGLPFAQHHYAAPEKRPPQHQVITKQKETTTTGLRDYNIITNRYLELHEDKKNTDQLIEKYELAEKYWKTHVYDPITGQYYDPKIEENYLNERDEEAKIHGKDVVYRLPISVQKEGLLYNPVNMKVEDPKRLEERDQREKRKKQRYETKYDMEEIHQIRGIEEFEKEKLQRMNRMNPRRYNDFQDRGFDIFSNTKFDSPQAAKTLYKPFVAEKPRVWDIIENQKADLCRSHTSSLSEGKPQAIESNPPSSHHSQASSKKSQAPPAVPSSKGSVLSQAGSKHIATRSQPSSNRSIRTGAFQRVSEPNI